MTTGKQGLVLRSIRDIDLRGKRVFVRVDFNVPLRVGSQGIEVEEDNRIREALPTIRYAIEQGARVILASHLGRPDGKPNPKYSLEPVAHHLASLLEKEVTLADDCVGDGIEMMASKLPMGSVLLLENLRFHPEEEACEEMFCRKLARLCEVYINDAFGTAHRKHASTYGLPKLMDERGMGFLIEKELKYLDPLLDHPQKPFYLILGGAKVKDKIKTIKALLPKVDGILVGGAMAFAFSAAKGEVVPSNAKQPGEEDILAAKRILEDAEKRGIPVQLPVDMIEAFDIGSKSCEEFFSTLQNAGTIFWNGPLGWFEKPEYSQGTFSLAKKIATLPALKIIGGGDTVAAIQQSGVAENYDHLSTGGGAVLEYLEGNGLPGIDVLKVHSRRD